MIDYFLYFLRPRDRKRFPGKTMRVAGQSIRCIGHFRDTSRRLLDGSKQARAIDAADAAAKAVNVKTAPVVIAQVNGGSVSGTVTRYRNEPRRHPASA